MKSLLSISASLIATAALAQQAAQPVGEIETQRITRKESAMNPFYSLANPDPFYVNLSTSYTHTTNAFSDSREQKDWLLDTHLAAGWRHIVGSSMIMDWAFLTNRSDYANQEQLSRNMLGTRFTLGGLAFRKLPYYLSYTGNWYYDSAYDSRSLDFHTLSTMVPFWRQSVGKGKLTLLSTLNWIKSQPSDFDQINPGLSVRFNLPVTDKDRIDISLLQSYAFYQHFVPSQFPNDRQDWRSSASVQFVHQFTKQFQISLGVAYLRNDSNLSALDAGGSAEGIFDYKTWNFIPTISLNYSF